MKNNELTHWGIKGMKWGVRRYQNKDGSLTPAGKKRLSKIDKKSERDGWSEDATSAAKLKTKTVKQLSNAELRKLNERTRLEQEYKNLNKQRTSAGQKVVNEILTGAAKDTAKSYVSKYMRQGIDLAVASMMKK